MQTKIPSKIRQIMADNKILREEPQPVETVQPNENAQNRTNNENANARDNREDVRDINENREENSRGNAPQNAEEQPQNLDNLNRQINLSLDEPYPEITNAEPSLFEVRWLKWLASSRKSEFSALNTYLYQFFVLRKAFPEIADTLRRISIVEMEHFEKLSNAIVAFGGNPNLTDGRGNVWTGRNVSNLRNVREILNFNIRAEREAIETYEDAILKTRNESLQDLYKRIIEDEKIHISVLESLLSSL